ncbi:unnamed protein product [Allacma fusca]|uniref:Carboxylic ester hydrolase n=1 Tax=Allacma fusca TaxID=39272 RepID=A0A8J2M9W7_9HEXA|nr:unnamed protein product [Allacma fusca]
MWGKNRGNIFLPIIFACTAYIGKFLFAKQLGPIIEIASGKIQGVIAYSREGREYFQFLSIPYARPPLGDLRFQSPQPPQNWTGVLLGDKVSPRCVGVEFLTSGRLVGQEDCLYLNVFVPKGKESLTLKAELLPVMVFIHGGGFLTGSASGYGEQYFMDEDIVLVSMNYRLGILGFLNAEDETARGNMGLKDQSMALRWVRDNIESFGGDPTKITIFGESAGGASVHFHMLSPMSKGLFDKAISMSGNALNPFWQTNRSYSEQVDMLGNRFACPTEPRKAFVNCLQRVDAAELSSIHAAVQSPVHPLRDAFSPSIESIVDSDAFLTTQPYRLLELGNFNKVPWLSGANQAEGLIFVARVIYNESLRDSLSVTQIWNKYMPVMLFYDESKQNASEEIRRHYLGLGEDFEVVENSASLAKLFSDRLFFQSMQNTALLHAQHAPLYLYHYTHQGALNVFNILKDTSPYFKLPMEFHVLISLLKNWVLKTLFGIPPLSLGPCHGDEMLMLFTVNSILDVSQSHVEDFEMSKTMIKTWTSFAKDEHSFKFRNLAWPAIKPNQPLKYMKLDSYGEILVDPLTEDVKIWEKFDIL